MRAVLLSLLLVVPLLHSPSVAAADPDERFSVGLSGGRAFEDDHHYTGFELEVDLPLNRYVVPFVQILGYDGNTPRTGEDGTTDTETIAQLNLGALFVLSLTPANGSPGARVLRGLRLFLRTGVGFEAYNDGLHDDNSGSLGPVITLGLGARLRFNDHLCLALELSAIHYPLGDDLIRMVKPSLGLFVNF